MSTRRPPLSIEVGSYCQTSRPPLRVLWSDESVRSISTSTVQTMEIQDTRLDGAKEVSGSRQPRQHESIPSIVSGGPDDMRLPPTRL